jgi:hypothetical protein
MFSTRVAHIAVSQYNIKLKPPTGSQGNTRPATKTTDEKLIKKAFIVN